MRRLNILIVLIIIIYISPLTFAIRAVNNNIDAQNPANDADEDSQIEKANSLMINREYEAAANIYVSLYNNKKNDNILKAKYAFQAYNCYYLNEDECNANKYLNYAKKYDRDTYSEWDTIDNDPTDSCI